MQVIRSLDFFGSPLVLQIDRNNSVHKSFVGGIITIIIMSVSLLYTAWMIMLWRKDELSPKISQASVFSDFRRLDLQYDVITIYYWDNKGQIIDPFKEKIIIPLIEYGEINFDKKKVEQAQFSKTLSDFQTYQIQPQVILGFSDKYGYMSATSQMNILFVLCQPDLLLEGEQCPSQEKMEQFFDQPQAQLIVRIKLKIMNPKDQTININYSTYYLTLEKHQCQSQDVFLQSNRYDIHENLFFNNPDPIELISSTKGQVTSNSMNYCSRGFGYDQVIAAVYITMENNQNLFTFDYPKISDILANIGSIISVLFLLKHIVYSINQKYLQHMLINQLITFYYPQYSLIKYHRNWRFKLTKVTLNGLQLNVKEFQEFKKDVKEKMRNKLTFTNIMYEISRIYFLLRSIKTREEIIKSHSIGIKLKVQNPLVRGSFTDFYTGIETPSIKLSHTQLLQDDDINLLSLSEKKKQDDKVSEEFYEDDFYEINRVDQKI